VRAEEGAATMSNKDTMSLILREPIGVVGRSSLELPAHHGGRGSWPPLAAGDCVVIKALF
jgi:acyl-CoA reductase-like NAD-dependent aldehyde dehydrogenase